MSEKDREEQDAVIQESDVAEETQGEVVEVQEPESTTDFEETVDPQTDDEKRAGVKDIAHDEDAMAIEKEKPKGEGKKGKIPSFFVEKGDRRKIEVDILSSRESGKIVSVSRGGLGLDFEKDFDYLRHDREWFEFTIPTYEDMSTYRQRCAVFRKEVGQMMVDRLQLRNFMLVWHLKDWSLTDREGKKIELGHDDDGSLSDVSLKKVYALHPTVLDIVLTVFEKDLLLT